MRIAHLSDLHFGHHDPRLASSLAADLAGQELDLVVVSGDFTQRGTEDEYRQAREFLDTVQAPVFAVPGNHDVPARNPMLRFLDPYRLYRRYIHREVEPFVEIGKVALAGIKTSRRWRPEINWANGSISRAQLVRLAGQFADASPGAIRLVVAHHPLLHPEVAMAKPMQLVKRADLALKTFAGLGVRLVLSGHFHLSYVRSHQHLGEVGVAAPDGPRKAAIAPILVAQTSTTISTRLRGHSNAYNLVDIEGDAITVRVREWLTDVWTTRERVSEPG